MAGVSPIARIQPAAWFRHALSLNELVEMTESRARALECGRDGRAAFARLRAAQLGRIARVLDAAGFRPAAGWIERLELEHVHRYLQAADSWDRGEISQTPAPWRAIFEHERGERPDAAASLRTGTIAHLTFDLPLALARIGVTTADGVDTATAYARLSEIYAVTTDEAVCGVSVHLGRPYLGRRRQPTITDAWQRELRAQAWDDAAELMRGDDHTRTIALRRIELAAISEIRRLIGGSR